MKNLIKALMIVGGLMAGLAIPMAATAQSGCVASTRDAPSIASPRI